MIEKINSLKGFLTKDFDFFSFFVGKILFI
jgi:hypothetical protein